MEGESDDFGLDNTGDLEIDHQGNSGLSTQAKAPAAGSGLFSSDGDDDFGAYDGRPPSGRVASQLPRPLPPGPGSRHGSSGQLSETDDYEISVDSADLAPRRTKPQPARPPALSSNRAASSGLFSSHEDDFGINSADLRSRPAPELPPRPPPPAPPPGQSSGGLFSESESYGLSELGAEIDHSDMPPSRRTPPSAANFTNPSLSLDANDSEIADLLGPQPKASAPGPIMPAALSQAGPARVAVVQLPPTPPLPAVSNSPDGYGLQAEDSELAELLGETPREAAARPALGAGHSSTRRISFQDPVAASLQNPVAASPPQSQRLPHPYAAMGPDTGSFGDDSGDGYGLEPDARRNLAKPLARRNTPSDDFTREEDYRGVTFDGGISAAAATVPIVGASFKRIPSPGSGYDPIQDPSDSPVARGGRPPPRGIAPRRQVGESSDAYFTYDNDFEGDDEEYYGNRDDRRGRGDVAFRRIPSPTRGPPPPRPAAPSPPGDDEYEDGFDDDEDVFADDSSWDGEIRFTPGPDSRGKRVATAARPGSARQPRSRGMQVAGGTRMRATSALPPRERQAALIEDMISRHPSSWDIREVATWVEFIGMGQYRPKFVHNCVDGGLLLSLGDAELARDLRILPLGHRRALLAAIAQLREAAEAMEQQRVKGAAGAAGAEARPKSETARVADLRRRAAEQEVGRRPSSAGARLIPPEPFLGPAAGKTTIYEQRAKLLYQLDRARHRAAQHEAIIEQLANNKALTEAQMADLRGKLKDLETKHKDDFSTTQRRGMTAPISPGGAGGAGRKGAAALAAAEYGPDAAVPWQPVGRGTRSVNPHPERFARGGEDPNLDLTFRPRVGRIEDVPAGAVRDIVAKALSSRTPFWQRMEFEFEKMRKEREAREAARRKRQEHMGFVRRGGEGDDEEQAKSPHWNNYWVPSSNRNASNHKKFKRGSENEELTQYRSFAKDKTRLSRWFKRFVDDDERTEGDMALERLINRMIRALVKTKAEVDLEVGDTFDKRIRAYFQQHGYKFETHISNTIMVRARGTRPPAPSQPDMTMYDFEEVEQYYPDYLKKKTLGAQDDTGGGFDDEENETRMVPKRTTWKRLIAIYYMERQKKIRAAVAMVKMSQFVQRHGVRWPPERDREEGKKEVWVPSSGGGALHQVDGRDRTFNAVGQENISLNAKLKKALGPPQPVTFQMKVKQQEENEAKAEALFALMGWPHSSGDPSLGPPMEPLLPADGGTEFFRLTGGKGGEPARQRQWQSQLSFFDALDALLIRALEMRRLQEAWMESWNRARDRGPGEGELSMGPPRAEELDWSNDPLMEMQSIAMERQRQEWLLEWEKARRKRERQAAQMRSQGYQEEDIDYYLGPQQEASEVDYAVQNHLMYNVEVLARFRPAELLRFKEVKGTKKMMAVYRALRTQMFLDDTRFRAERKEERLRAMYESFRPGSSRRFISAEEQDAIYIRLKQDEAKREARRHELLEAKRAEEEASLTPWYRLPRPISRGPSQPGSRSTSPGYGPSSPGRRSTRSPSATDAAPSITPRRPSSAARTRAVSRGGGQLEGEGSSRSSYVFGSSTPKSIWDPVSWQRQARRIGASLLDSPGLQGGQSTASLSLEKQRTPGPASRSGARSGGTPTRQRQSTPTRPSGGEAPSHVAGRSPVPPQRPRSAQAQPASLSRLSGGGAGSSARRPASATPPSSTRVSAGASATNSPRPAAPAVPLSPRSRVLPSSPSRGRGAAMVPPASPRRSTARVAFRAPPSPTRSSGGGSPVTRGRAGAIPRASRRGLMDGDTTSGASASPSPERRITAGGGTKPSSRGGAMLLQQARRGLADTDSSPSPSRPPLRRTGPEPPPVAVAPAAGTTSSVKGVAVLGEVGYGVPQSRRSSAASETERLGVVRAVAGASSTGATIAVPVARLSRQTSGQSRVVSPPQGLSQQSSASSVMGLQTGGGGGNRVGAVARGSASGSTSGPPAVRVSASGTGSAGHRTFPAGSASGGTPRASGTGSASGPGPAPASRLPSTASGFIQQESSSTSKSSSTSAGIRAGGGGGPVRGSSAGSTAQRSSLSRSPAAASPLSASPRDASPLSHSPPPQSPPPQLPLAASPRNTPSPQPSHPRLLAVATVEAETTEGSAGEEQEDDYALDEYEMDAAEGEQLDYGDEIADGADEF